MQAQQALEKIKGLQLTKTTRTDLVQYFHFGKAHYTTPQGLILDVGAFVLAVHAAWQLEQPDEASIKYSEVYLRKREAGMPSVKFDWKEPGANLRDQRLKELVNQNGALVVEMVEFLTSNGFILHFANNARLSITPEQGQEVYWQLFSNVEDFSVTANATGLVQG